MTLAEMRSEVVRIIQDESYTSTTIDRMLNQSVKDICGGVMILWPEGDQTLSLPMGELYTISDVNTNATPHVTLPSTYQRDVVFVATNYEVEIYNNFGDFRRSFPTLDMSGNVIAAAVKGRELYYQGIPSTSQTMKVHYYAYPTEMTADGDTPGGVPERFHMTLVVYDTCLKIFNEIYEEDAEQHMVIKMYEGKRMNELIALDSLNEVDTGSVIFK